MVLVVSVEMFENLMKLWLSLVVKVVFGIGEIRVRIVEVEFSVLGRDLVYIYCVYVEVVKFR